MKKLFFFLAAVLLSIGASAEPYFTFVKANGIFRPSDVVTNSVEFDFYNNGGSYNAFQMDLYLPEGINISNYSYVGSLTIGPVQFDSSNRRFCRIVGFMNDGQAYPDGYCFELQLFADEQFAEGTNTGAWIENITFTSTTGNDADNWSSPAEAVYAVLNIAYGFMGKILENGNEVAWPYLVTSETEKTAFAINTSYTASPVALTGDVEIPATVTDESGKTYTVTGIEHAFGSQNARSYFVPNTVNYISSDAFDYARNTYTITVAADNPTYDSRDECNAIIHTATNTLIEGCQGTVIPKSVETIGSVAFDGIFIDESADICGMRIPTSVKAISGSAFGSAYFPAIVCDAVTPPVITDNVDNFFTQTWDYQNDNCSWNQTHTQLYVPIGTSSAYASAPGWSLFSNTEFLGGDVNFDNVVNVVDVVDVVRYIIGNQRPSFNRWIADADGNRTITIADAMTLANIIVGWNSWTARSNTPKGTAAGSDALSLRQNEDKSLSVCLDNVSDFTAFQMKVTLPASASMLPQLSTNRKNGHQIAYRETQPGEYTIVVYSLQNNTFNGNEGELLNMQFGYGSEQATVSDIHFVTPDCRDITFSDMKINGTSGVTTISQQTVGNDAQNIYNINGQRVTAPQKGIYVMGGKKMVKK